jgi:ribosomal protein L2
MAFLYKGPSLKCLTITKKNTGGRNDFGKITVYHRGDGCKKKSRIVDYKRFI